MAEKINGGNARQDNLQIGWAHCDLTPDFPVLIPGQFHARISEGVLDPITATALAISGPDGRGGETQIIWVSLDWLWVLDDFRDAVRRRIKERAPDLNPQTIILSATHTHSAPHAGPDTYELDGESNMHREFFNPGIDLKTPEGERYFEFAVERLAAAIAAAWQARQPGSVEYGIEFAVVCHNRRIQDIFGSTAMYGKMNSPEFSHVEGHEEHSIQILATRDKQGELTGLVLNVACPSQVSQQEFRLSADFWHEVRRDVKKRLGTKVHVLAQCAAAGDLHPPNTIILPDVKAWQRMNETRGYSGDYPQRQIIADRLLEAVERALPTMAQAGPASPILRHTVLELKLPYRIITNAEYESAKGLAMTHEGYYNAELDKLRNDPTLLSEKRWYQGVTREHRRWHFNQAIVARCEKQRSGAKQLHPLEVHCVRIGEIALATNPFELFHDYGLRIRCRSVAKQTFIVQLTGSGTYLPTERAAKAGGYSAIPASGPVGPEGGTILVNETLKLIELLMQD